jgi:hypothetical protein
MDQTRIVRYITDTFAGVAVVAPNEGIAAGDTFFFYDPHGTPDAQRFPFATIVTKDYGEFDCASQLDRPGVYRLNIGVSRATFQRLFGSPPRADAAGGDTGSPDPAYDFAALDELLPHPVYAPQSWVCVLNPSEDTFRRLQPLLGEAYDRAVRRYQTAPPGDAGAAPANA